MCHTSTQHKQFFKNDSNDTKGNNMTQEEFNALVNLDISIEILQAQRKALLDDLQEQLHEANKSLQNLRALVTETDRRTSVDGYRSVDGQIAAMRAITAQANVLHLEKLIREYDR
jgi:hypothetical protein